MTIYKNTTLGFSEIVPEAVMNNISKLSKPLPAPIKDKKYNLNILNYSVDKDISKRFHDQFGSLVKDFSAVSSNQNGIQVNVISQRSETNYNLDRNLSKFPLVGCRCFTKRICRRKFMFFLERELIPPYHSPYSASVMLVPKKNGKLRLVIDDRQLNRQTIKSTWPIPSIEEKFETLERSAPIGMSAGF